MPSAMPWAKSPEPAGAALADGPSSAPTDGPSPALARAARLAVISIGVGLCVLALKFLAAQLTGSVALWSDALESIVNVLAAVVALVAIRVAARPPDAGHPFGHGKAEYLSAVAEGVLIVVAALAILHEAWQGLLDPQPLAFEGWGMAASLAATGLNGAWAWILIRAGRDLRSAALDGDGRHLLADVVTSAGVLIGVALALVTGLAWLDPALAAVVGCFVIASGWSLVRKSVDGLMDAVPVPERLALIEETIAARLPVGARAFALRAREAGYQVFIDFHLAVDGAMPVRAAHDICDRIEAALGERLPGARVTIHVEPEGGQGGEGGEGGEGGGGR